MTFFFQFCLTLFKCLNIFLFRNFEVKDKHFKRQISPKNLSHLNVTKINIGMVKHKWNFEDEYENIDYA